ncbi:MAG: amidohydrolase family protein [Phycisphaerae bacterium]|nr:amidohydrolase family protein [Phycisphaerae bacterium]
MIVDCHTHIGFASSDESVAGFVNSCQGVDTTLVLATPENNAKNANKDLRNFLDSRPNLIGFGLVHPLADNIGSRSLGGLREMGFQGLVVYCSSGAFHPTHTRAMRLYEGAVELNLPIFFHNCTPMAPGDILEFAQPMLLDEVARSFPDLKMIVGNMGLPFLSQTLCMLSKHPNVFADLSIVPSRTWEVYNLIVQSFEWGVMDKLLFGSGYPTAMPGNCIETLLGFNRMMSGTNLPIVPREKIRAIIERNTLALLGLNSPSA